MILSVSYYTLHLVGFNRYANMAGVEALSRPQAAMTTAQYHVIVPSGDHSVNEGMPFPLSSPVRGLYLRPEVFIVHF